jgi:transcriptional regulator with XRE-family HTH domain
MTQIALATAAGMSQRMVSHYECEIENPNAEMVVKLAQALRVTTDELLGIKPVRRIDDEPTVEPAMRRYLKRIRAITALSERDQKSVLRMLDNTIRAHGSLRHTQAS